MTDMTHDTDLAAPVVTARRRWTIVMIAVSMLDMLVQSAYAANWFQHTGDDLGYVWGVVGLVAGLATPFLLLRRGIRPAFVCAAACMATLLLPAGAALSLFALASVHARCRDRRIVAACTALVLACCFKVEAMDVLRPNEYSVWRMLFARPGTGVDGVPAVVETDSVAIIAVATLWTIVTFAAAILAGMHMRNRAVAADASARANNERERADQLQSNLSTQRFADAVAAEAHDTLAHSLSLIAVNASALQAQAMRLASTSVGAQDDEAAAGNVAELAKRADEIRRQAAGALDEAHSIIDMLRHPQDAQAMMAPDSGTALTREALYDVIDAARSAGMTLDTWIDVRDLSSLNPEIGKIAFRAVQEGLTNARRHAPGQRVSLEITAARPRGVIILFTNATMPSPTVATDVPHSPARGSGNPRGSGSADRPMPLPRTGGNGLPGLRTRVQQVGGTCDYGYDGRNAFHLDVKLPFKPLR
ncbi:sensor histidine kinase [Bifidobacterium sp. 82T24]|uniref:sensor histidine kinase n=1 Tax=Bifidobacterium pluvialisilvae TaxID=2834436 RepID=UPI001C566D35|nr:histidine kinase [Bifidobacterium pluvialisilvae]MBW3087346.1 sensor histidine kinase [Bifidobacterium pluvialisilvae]